MSTWQVLEHEYFDYSGTWEMLKGEQKQANNIAQQQLQLQQQAFNLEKGQIGQVNAVAAPFVTPQGQGFTPEQMALLNSQSANTVNQGYNSAAQNVRSILGARGEGLGNLPMGTPAIQGFSQLEGARASDLANAYRTNQLANMNQALTNRFNAAALMAGQTPNFTNNTGQFGSQGLSALNTANQAYSNSFGGQFYPTLGSLSGQLGTRVGAGLLGGFLNNLASKNTLNSLYNSGGINLAGDLGTNASMIAGLSSLVGNPGSATNFALSTPF